MIRDATPSDHGVVAPLWEACLATHGLAPAPGAFDRTWARVLAGDGFGLRLAVTGPETTGFALHSWQWNSWAGAEEGCLDTLFVAEEARGRGVARALLDDLLALARARGWRSVYWHVTATNAPARALYDSLARPDDTLRYRVVP